MSSKKVMKQMQKLAFQRHKNNIKNNKFKPKTNKIFNKHKKWKVGGRYKWKTFSNLGYGLMDC